MSANKKIKAIKKETEHSSLIVRWVIIVALTIVVSFTIFSIVIYSTVSQQSISQQKETSQKVVTNLDSRLNTIDSELQIANVVPALSPSTRDVLKSGANSVIRKPKDVSSAFSDDLLSSVTNPDVLVAVYNKHNEIVFSNGMGTPKLKKFKADTKFQKQTVKGKQILVTYSKVISSRSGKVTGYIVVLNKMTYYNKLMHNLLIWMLVISVAAIIIFTIIAFLVVRDVVDPINQISAVAREVNNDPNSEVRIQDLHRHDELEELAESFNSMLDRMQRYIVQQKEFVSDVSHELRTPVAVIEGHLNMLKRWGKEDPEILDESIDASIQEADRMKHLIQEMLDLTRAEQINVQYPNKTAVVSDILRRVTGDMQMVHPDFNVQLDMEDLPEETKIQIYQGHLEQLLVILIDNGIKYSTDLKQINVSAGLTQDKVRIIVQDFGEGISQEDQDKIFNRFYRVDKARTREKGGNGLGLSIAQKLVTSYHGEISVKSVLGQGSQFIMEFPVISKKEALRLEKLDQKQVHGDRNDTQM